jgi:hypothetical protein
VVVTTYEILTRKVFGTGNGEIIRKKMGEDSLLSLATMEENLNTTESSN